MLVKRCVFSAVGTFAEDIKCVADHDYWLRISLQFSFDFVPEALEAHRKWELQMTKNKLAFAEAHMRLVSNFIQTHGDLLEPPLVKRIWAAAYVGLGATRAELGSNGLALRALAKAMAYRPVNLSAYKAVAKTLLGKVLSLLSSAPAK